METTQKQMPSLALCILIDIVGYSSFGVPLLGEFFDLAWAPISAFLFYRMFGGKMGVVGGGVSFLEEILPFTDFIPTFTIAWVMKYFAKNKTSQAVVLRK
jgi:hypothetical protein